MSYVYGGTALAVGIALSDLSHRDIWVRYLAIGGQLPYPDMWRYVLGLEPWPEIEHDVATQALNELLRDAGLGGGPVAYANEV